MSETTKQERQSICDKVSDVFYSHTQSWYIGLVVHGSAVKGGFIQGWSDIDFQLYLEDSAVNEKGQLPLSLCVAIHRDLAKIDPYPFQYIQTRVLTPSFPHFGGLVPDTYELLKGRLLIPDLTNDQLHERAKENLKRLDSAPLFPSERLMDHGDDRLWKEVRAFCTTVWPALYHVLTLQHNNGVAIWKLPKGQAIDLLPLDNPMGHSIRRFHNTVLAMTPNQSSVDHALSVVERGVDFLETVREWWAGTRNNF